jgi:O-succinylhomoserine sulfhydrylase
MSANGYSVSWVLVKGLETLRLRVDAQCRAAERIAAELEQMPGVERVLYPTLDSHPQCDLARRQLRAGGTVVALHLDGGDDAKERAFAFLDALSIFDISNNLGDTKSLVTHPATTTHRRVPPEQRQVLGITDAMVRLSIGLEDPDDLLMDLERALKLAMS